MLVNNFIDNFWLYFYSNYSILAFVLVLIVFAYRHVSYTLNYWTRLGVSGPRPLPIIGTIYQWWFYPVSDVGLRNVNNYGKVYGTYFLHKPQLNIADPELAKHILVKDFNVFVNHPLLNTQDPLFDRILFYAEDDDWRQMRHITSPAFNGLKLRRLHPLVDEVVNNLVKFVRKAAETKSEIELEDLASRYIMQNTVLCDFSTRTDVINEPDNKFLANVEKMLDPKMFARFAFVKILKSIPLVNRFITMPGVDPTVSGFFKQATKEIINRRSGDENKPQDVLQLMLDAQQQKNKIGNKTNKLIENETKKYEHEFGELEVLANSFGFFMAGFETTHFISAFFYLLAMNQDIQEQLFQEIDKHVDEKGNVDYDTLHQMPFLDACVSEGLRLLNPIIEVQRVAKEDYHLPGTDIVIKKNLIVNVMIDAIHHNPEYYPNPHQFDPTRFLPENKNNLVPYTYLPFGSGPRNCLGLRFSLLIVKAVFAGMIKRFRFVRTKNTPDKIKFKKFWLILAPEGELPVGAELR